MVKPLKIAPVVFLLLVTTFFSIYKLSESPRTWMDEGIITQVSKNVAEYGKHALQVAPERFVSAGIVSTGFPVTFPIALSFKFFGTGLLQARIVMVIFILLLISTVFFYLKRLYGMKVGFWGTLLVATFSPLYGNGKNVLGEVPGLFFFFAMLLFIDKAIHDKEKISNYILAGLFTGLAFSTKSIFILLLPALLVASLWHFYRGGINFDKYYLYSFISFIAVFFLWIYIQFSNDSISKILLIYANPYYISVIDSIKNNLLLFIGRPEPIYFLGTLLIWIVSYFYRIKKAVPINFSESLALMFSILIFLAFFRTPGYFRYFFLAQFISLVYLLPSLNSLFSHTKLSKFILWGIGILIVFHIYMTSFHSWVASHYRGTRSHDISILANEISDDGKILFYQVPEFIIFLKNNNYHQFIDITALIKVGEENKALVENGYFDKIVINDSVYDKNDSMFKYYGRVGGLDHYIILKKNKL
ncbi:MAG: glycosyltransferase family 39 protein [Minisyncoccia bacterium]